LHVLVIVGEGQIRVATLVGGSVHDKVAKLWRLLSDEVFMAVSAFVWTGLNSAEAIDIGLALKLLVLHLLKAYS
jgi:hypothetical protein